MMSRERELLQTALGILEDYEWGYGGDHHKSPEASILNDIKKLLAEPEEEPKFNFDLERMKVAIESPISDVTVDDLAKQVKQEPVAWMNDSGGCFLSDGNKYSENWTALYTAPPKRRPLSDEEIDKGYQESDRNYYDLAFRDGVRFAEKHNGIGVDNE